MKRIIAEQSDPLAKSGGNARRNAIRILKEKKTSLKLDVN
jgi:hypothetical protein